jgi:hypothetical protein
VATEDITVEQAQSVIRADYWEDVSNVADDFQRAVNEREITDREDGETWLHETVDGHSRVIYTGAAILGLYASKEDNAQFEETGERGDFSQQMYYAFMADIRDELERRGVDLNDPEPEEDEEEEEDEDAS